MKTRYPLLLLTLAACANQVVVDPGERLAMAKELAGAGDSAAATRIVAGLVKNQPEWSRPHLNEFAEWATAAGDWENSRAWANQVLADEPDSLSALRSRGIARQHLGDPAGAAADLARVERSTPPDSAVKRALGLALVTLDQEPERARALLLDPLVEGNAQVQEALAKLEKRLHPKPDWVGEAAPTLATIAGVLEEKLGLTKRLQATRPDWERADEHQQAAAEVQDLPANPAAAGALRACVEAGVLRPQNDRLGSEAPLRRSAFAALIARLLDATVGPPAIPPGSEGPTPFADVSPRHPLFADIQAAVAVGAMRAGPGRRFRPDDLTNGRDLQLAVDALGGVWSGADLRPPAAPSAARPKPPVPSPEDLDLLSGVFTGTGIGLDKEQGLEAAYQDAVRQAARAWPGELGVGELPGLLEEDAVARMEALGGLLRREPLEEKWDPEQNLATVRLRVSMERARFQGIAGRALRVAVRTSGRLDPGVLSVLRGRFVAQGFEVLDPSAAAEADAAVQLAAEARKLPGGLGRRQAWERSLAVTVTARSSLTHRSRLLMERTLGPEKAWATSAAEALRDFPAAEDRLPLASDIADRILRGHPARRRQTVVLQAGAGRRFLVDDLIQGLRAKDGVEVDEPSLTWLPPVASFDVTVDRRAGAGLAQVLQSITLDAGRRVRVLQTAGDRLVARIVDPTRD